MEIRKTPLTRSLSGLALALLLAQCLGLALFWPQIPDKVPTHFGATGLPDAWGKKGTILLPLFFGLFVYGLLTLVSRFPAIWSLPLKPQDQNRPAAYQATYVMFQWMKLIFVAGFSYILLMSALSKPLGSWFTAAFLVGIFLPLIYLIFKCVKKRPKLK